MYPITIRRLIEYLMKKILALIASIGLCISTQALVIDLGTSTGQPANVSSEIFRLNTQIDLYNNLNDPDLSGVLEWNGSQTSISNGGPIYSLNLSGFDGYLILKWGDMDRFYYINDIDLTPFNIPTVLSSGDGNYTFFSDVSNQNGRALLGLSHYTSVTPPVSVPDSGNSLGLLGLGVLFLALGVSKKHCRN